MVNTLSNNWWAVTGLQKGPTAVSRADHLNRLGAHLSYGWATAVLTKLFNQIF